MKVNKKDFKNADLLCLEMFKNSVLTEKSVNEEMVNNCMTFLVRPNITKNHIRISVEALFKTEVISVRVINTKGRMKQFKRTKFMTPGYKKVMVKVADLDAIRRGLDG